MKIGNTSDEMVTLMRTGKYDGVSASGDATLRLIAGGDVDPVNVDLIPNYKDIFPALKNQPHNTVDGVNYGIPHGRGANLLMFNKDVGEAGARLVGRRARRGPRAEKYKGKVTAYDNPIYIADAALYLKATQPDLGIDNVYELDDKQFDAAVDLLKQQRDVIGEYWSDYTKEQAAFTSGDSVVGTTWQVIANLVAGRTRSRRRSRRSCRRRGRPGGRTPGCSPPRPSTRTACTSGWTTSSARRRTPPWPSGSARPRPTRSRVR